MSQKNNFFRPLLPLLLVTPITSGCGLAAVGVSIAAAELTSSLVDVSTELSGEEVWGLANWDRTKFSKQTGAIFGEKNWVCARNTGRTVCIPEAAQPFEPSDRFRCEYGQGGVFQRAFSGDATVLFCRQA